MPRDHQAAAPLRGLHATDEGLDQKYNSIYTQRDADRAVRSEATRITPDHL
jgi:hypothetical protein